MKPTGPKPHDYRSLPERLESPEGERATVVLAEIEVAAARLTWIIDRAREYDVGARPYPIEHRPAPAQRKRVPAQSTRRATPPPAGLMPHHGPRQQCYLSKARRRVLDAIESLSIEAWVHGDVGAGVDALRDALGLARSSHVHDLMRFEVWRAFVVVAGGRVYLRPLRPEVLDRRPPPPQRPKRQKTPEETAAARERSRLKQQAYRARIDRNVLRERWRADQIASRRRKAEATGKPR